MSLKQWLTAFHAQFDALTKDQSKVLTSIGLCSREDCGAAYEPETVMELTSLGRRELDAIVAELVEIGWLAPLKWTSGERALTRLQIPEVLRA